MRAYFGLRQDGSSPLIRPPSDKLSCSANVISKPMENETNKAKLIAGYAIAALVPALRFWNHAFRRRGQVGCEAYKVFENRNASKL